MSKGIETTGVIVAQHRNRFDVQIEQGSIVSAVEGGKIRRNNVWLVPGDKCLVELCVYEPTKARILRRL